MQFKKIVSNKTFITALFINFIILISLFYKSYNCYNYMSMWPGAIYGLSTGMLRIKRTIVLK